jgi:hypothetical protein
VHADRQSKPRDVFGMASGFPNPEVRAQISIRLEEATPEAGATPEVTEEVSPVARSHGEDNTESIKESIVSLVSLSGRTLLSAHPARVPFGTGLSGTASAGGMPSG